jgi:hypothetical protein
METSDDDCTDSTTEEGSDYSGGLSWNLQRCRRQSLSGVLTHLMHSLHVICKDLSLADCVASKL